MTLPAITTTTWVQVHTAGTTECLQVRGGRVLLADSATPAEHDYIVLSDGATIDVTADKWAQKMEPAAILQVSAL